MTVARPCRETLSRDYDPTIGIRASGISESTMSTSTQPQDQQPPMSPSTQTLNKPLIFKEGELDNWIIEHEKWIKKMNAQCWNIIEHGDEEISEAKEPEKNNLLTIAAWGDEEDDAELHGRSKRICLLAKEEEDEEGVASMTKMVSSFIKDKKVSGSGRCRDLSQYTCYLCQQTGHLSKNCPSLKESQKRRIPFQRQTLKKLMSTFMVPNDCRSWLKDVNQKRMFRRSDGILIVDAPVT